MKLPVFRLTFLFVVASSSLMAQANLSASDAPPAGSSSSSVNPGSSAILPTPVAAPAPALRPFSRLALGGGISLMGVDLQAAVNANRYMNIRATGNFFNYSLTNIGVSGFTVNGKLNLATAGASLDYYPFPNHGFRISPGLLLYNSNGASATIAASGGTSFTLNSTTYYSSAANPVTGTGSVNLHSQNPAFTVTTGWGNMISRRGGHFSIPFELGAAIVGSPTVNLALTSGQVCTSPQGTEDCQNVVGDAALNTNLQAQIAKYKNDLNPFRVYPIFSIGVAYNFGIRGGAGQIAHANPPAQP